MMVEAPSFIFDLQEDYLNEEDLFGGNLPCDPGLELEELCLLPSGVREFQLPMTPSSVDSVCVQSFLSKPFQTGFRIHFFFSFLGLVCNFMKEEKRMIKEEEKNLNTWESFPSSSNIPNFDQDSWRL